MRSTVEVLDDNKVKVVVEVEEAEFEKDIDAAFKKLAKEVRLPGFRPGKAPRKVLEARIGSSYARDEAFREALPGYYSQAVDEHEVDVIAPPEIDITDGREEGPVSFDAVVEVRPAITITGYEGLEVTVDASSVDEEDVDRSIDRMRAGFGELETVDRPGEHGDRAVIDIETFIDGEPVDGLSTDGYVYEIGSEAAGIAAIDEALVGASAGDELEITAPHPQAGDDDEVELDISIRVSEIQEMVLPEATDEWARDASEFDTIEELRADIRQRMTSSRVMSARNQRSNAIADALVGLVDDESVPPAMIDSEFQGRLEDLVHRLSHQGMEFERYLELTGQSQEDLIASVRSEAVSTSKLDLALRAIVAAEQIEVTDDDVDSQISEMAEQFSEPVDKIRAEFENNGGLRSVRTQLVKGRALEWVTERAKLVDADGQPVAAEALELPADDEDDEDELDGEDGQ